MATAFDLAAAQSQIAANIAYAPSATLAWSAPGGGVLSLPAMIEDEPASANALDANPGDATPVRVTIARGLFAVSGLPRQNQYFTAEELRYRITAVKAHPTQPVAVFTCTVT